MPIDGDLPAASQDLIVPRLRANSWVLFLVASTLVLPALVLTAIAGVVDVAVTLAVVGLPIVYWTARNAIFNPPLLRASEHGLRFGGGKLVPWHAVKMVGEARLDMRLNGVCAGSAGVAIYFHQSKTILRLPMVYWMTSFLNIGDVDVSTVATKQSARVIEAQLEARRTHALGNENAVTVGATALPAAHVRRSD